MEEKLKQYFLLNPNNSEENWNNFVSDQVTALTYGSEAISRASFAAKPQKKRKQPKKKKVAI